MTKYITIKLTEDQFNAVFRSVENNFRDYHEFEYDTFQKRDNAQARKENAYLQRLLDKLAQAKSKVTS